MFFGCCGATVSQLHGQPATFADPKFWMPDGPINAIVAVSNTLYLGGDFSYIGPRTGPAALFDQASGQLLASPPQMAGTVKAVVPDGSGGWFIGGSFTKIGDTLITNVAHLKSDFSVDASWDARVIGIAVNALALDSGRLYVGGQFTRIGGQTISSLAGVTANDATVDWNPQFSGTVNAMGIGGGLLYVGGNFFSVGNSNRQNLAAISTTTALANGWDPVADQAVLALQVSGSTIYVGGQFTTAGTKPRNRLAAIDATTGVASTWNPNSSGIVRALGVGTGVVFVGGDFTTIGGQNRRGFAAVNSGNGAVAAGSLNLQLQSVSTVNLVRSLLLDGNSLYVGGQFTNALAGAHVMVVGVDLITSLPLPTPLATDFNGTAGAAFGANALAVANGRVVVGGEFVSFGGVARRGAAALSVQTGTALPWAPAFYGGPVLSLAYGTNGIYAGGSFTNLNTTNFVQGLAVVDPLIGLPVSPFVFLGTNQFNPVSINALVLRSGALYAGGAFTVVANQSRRFLAMLDPGSGAPDSVFNANLGGGFAGVSSLVLSGTNLYVGGDFTTVNAVSVPRLAAVSATNGAAVSWTPSPNQAVNVLAATADTLYVGGQFTTISSVSFRNFAAYSLADNSLLGIDAALNTFSSGVNAIGATPTTLYVGGTYTSIGGEFRQNLACLASFNASSYDWNPSPDVAPSVITLTDHYAFVGGAFRFLGQSPTNRVHGFFAAFSRAPQPRIALSPGNVQIFTTTGDRTDAVVQATPSLSSPTWTNVATNDVPGFSWTLTLPSTKPQEFFRVIAR